MMRVAVIGAGGRMGRLIAAALQNHPALVLGAAVERAEKIGAPGDAAYTCDLDKAVAGVDVVVDFSSPESTLGVVAACVRAEKPLLVGTTGQSEHDLRAIRAHAPTAPILIAPNTSIGVHVFARLVREARAVLGPSFDVEIMEIHHRGKRDAPSGTARFLAQAAATEREQIVCGRAGLQAAERPRDEVGIASLRGGDVPGDHTVFFLGAAERLEITHRVRDRAVFAEGALRLAAALVGRPARFYEVSDLL